MSTALWRTLAVLVLFVAGFAVGATWTHSSQDGAADFPPGGDEGRTRLLLRCPPGRVADVLKALDDQPVEVWSLRSREPLRTDVPAVPPEAGVPPEGAPTVHAPLPPLASAVEVLGAVETALATLEGPLVLMTDCSVQERRAVVTVVMDDAALGDQVARVLAASPALQARGVDVQPGSIQQLGGRPTRWKTKFALAFDLQKPGRKDAPTYEGLLHRTVSTAAQRAKLQMTWAGAEQKERHPNGGVTTMREYKFTNARVTEIRAFFAALGELDPSLTVFELRWSITRQASGRLGGVLTKPTVRVGGRSAP